MKQTEFERMVKAAFDVIGTSANDPSISFYDAFQIYTRAILAARKEQYKKGPKSKVVRAVAAAYMIATDGLGWDASIRLHNFPLQESIAVTQLTALIASVGQFRKD